MNNDILSRRTAVWVFVAFASAYFLSALLRAITATLSPTLSLEFGLQARDLGLLAGGYFFGFSLTQLLMGHWLDRYGPKKSRAQFSVRCRVGQSGLLMGDRLLRLAVGAGLDWCRGQRLLDGTSHWVSTLVGA